MARERALRAQPAAAKPPSAVRARSKQAVAQGPVREKAKVREPRNRRVPRPAEKRPEQARVRARVVQAWGHVKAALTRFRTPGVMFLRGVSVLAMLACAVAAGRLVQHHLTTSSAFAIDTIEVRGLSRIKRPELLEAAGIDLGSNAFERSPDEVRARLLRHPWVASASVNRRLPSRFDIEVKEREPVALLVVEACSPELERTSADPSCDDASALYLVSDEATVFKRLEAEDPVDMPVITGIDRQRFGVDRAHQESVLREAVTLLDEYKAAGLWKRLPIGEIHVERGDGFSLYVGEELTHVRLGVPPFGQKLRRMRKVFERLEREKASAEYVYLDNELRPDRVTVRLR